jgi:hypothetical protein
MRCSKCACHKPKRKYLGEAGFGSRVLTFWLGWLLQTSFYFRNLNRWLVILLPVLEFLVMCAYLLTMNSNFESVLLEVHLANETGEIIISFLLSPPSGNSLLILFYSFFEIDKPCLCRCVFPPPPQITFNLSVLRTRFLAHTNSLFSAEHLCCLITRVKLNSPSIPWELKLRRIFKSHLQKWKHLYRVIPSSTSIFKYDVGEIIRSRKSKSSFF